MAVIFILGFFLDFIEIAVVVVPIVAPILLADPSANITAVWLGVMIGLNIQTSFLTPPFGFALFYMRGVAPAAVKTDMLLAGFSGNDAALNELERFHPSNSLGEPAEIAELVLFLCSGSVPFLNGSTIEAGGGIHARLHDPV